MGKHDRLANRISLSKRHHHLKLNDLESDANDVEVLLSTSPPALPGARFSLQPPNSIFNGRQWVLHYLGADDGLGGDLLVQQLQPST